MGGGAGGVHVDAGGLVGGVAVLGDAIGGLGDSGENGGI